MPLQRARLDNGLTVLAQPLPGVASVAIGLTILSGSRDEARSEAGLCHLAEHMLFQGTARRDNRELSRVITAVGGQLDAYTSRENTAYYARVPTAHLDLVLDVLADMIRHSRVSTNLLRKEKRVILEEIRMVADEPEEVVHDLFAEALWPRHALGRPILGNAARLRQVTRTDLLNFMERHYQPGRTLLAIAGNVGSRRALALAQRHFASWHPQAGDAAPPVPPEAPAAAVRSLFKGRKLEQAHLCLGGQGLAFSHPARLAAVAMSNILGGSANSRLFYEVRERRALAYVVYSFIDFFRDTGLSGVYLACDPRKMKAALAVVNGEIRRLATHPVSNRELRDVRAQMRGNLLISLENPSNHMWRMLQNEMYSQAHPSTAKTLAAIDCLTAPDIQKAAHALWLEKPAAVAWVGPEYLANLGHMVPARY